MSSIEQKAKNIKLLLLDVDGVLTNGQIILGNNNEEYKAFHVHDGEGISMLQSTGVIVGLVTKRKSTIVTRRAEELKINYVYQGQKNKLDAFTDLLTRLKLKSEEIAYMGDDVPDLAVLARVGLSSTVANAPEVIRKQVDWISQFKGGEGAVRELCELLMKAQKTYETTIKNQSKSFLH